MDNFSRSIDLQELGADVSFGNILFSDAEHIILRTGSDERTFLENIRTFLRLSNSSHLSSSKSLQGLSICDLISYNCRQLISDGVDYNTAFHLEKYTDDSFFLSDTSRHRIVMFLKFPNQIKYLDDKLYVANTNKKQIKILSVNSHNIELFKNIDVVPDVAGKRYETYPVSVSRVNDQWWVINLHANMRNGGVYRFNNEWQFISLLNLPDNADPVDILSLHNNEVLIADRENFIIYKFSSDGKSLAEFTSNELAELFSSLRGKREFYALLSYIPVVIFVIAIFVGLVLGVRIDKRERDDVRAGHREEKVELYKSNEIRWLTINSRLLNKLYFLLLAFGGLTLFNFSIMYAMFDDADKYAGLVNIFILVTVLTVFLPILLIFYMKTALKVRLGIQGDYIHLIDHRGKASSGVVTDVYYSENALILNDVAVFIGSKQQPFFIKDELQVYLYPLLEKANKINPLKMSLKLFRLNHPSIYLNAFIIAMVVFIYVLT